MNLFAGILFVTTFTLSSPSQFVLRSGQTIEVAGVVRIENARAIFRSTEGTLYSIPLSEIDEEASNRASVPLTVVRAGERSRLRVSDEEKKRLLEELSRNHSGQPAKRQAILESPPPPPSKEEVLRETRDEWAWRKEARSHEEAIIRARENLDMVIEKAERLRAHIASLISLGYRPGQFTYDTTVLQATIEQIPYAELAVKRAERAYAQFRDDARRQGVTPGWLR